MRKLLLALLAVISIQLHAQNNLEGQIIASDYGAFQVPGIATGSLHFEPATCQVSAGTKNFAAFTTGVPLKIVDSNPNLNEIDTPAAVFINDCSISMSTSHIHATPFYVTSGTGGLQEALINGPSKSGGANTVILNADWYTQVLPGNPATVIASVKGNTSLGLVDVTTSPYTYYTWGGSAYTQVAPPSQLPGGNGVVKVVGGNGALATPGTDYVLPTGNISGTAGNLSGTPALNNGITATTQTTGDNTTKLATDAFVIANTGGATFPSTNGIVFNTGVGTSRNTTPSDISALFTAGASGCTTAGNVYSPQSNTCISPGGNPGGSDTQVQVNHLGAFAGFSGFTYDNSTQTMTVGPLGTANSGANFNSGTSQVCGSLWTGSAAMPDCWYWVDVVPSGTNPFTEVKLLHSGGSGGGQLDLGLTEFLDGFVINSTNDSGSITVGAPANMPSGSYQINPPDVPPSGSSNFLSCPLTGGSIYTCVWASGGGGLAVTPQGFGGYGDAFSPPDGFNTTASSTTVTFTDGSLISTLVDGGKDVWISGAGAAGVAFHSTIVSVTNSTTAIVAAAPSISLSNAHGVYGHDDKTAIQSCIKYSSVNAVQCWLVPQPAPAGQNGVTGFLVGSGSLQLTSNNALEQNSGPNIVGNSQGNGTNLFCEYNGDCLTIASGPIQGVNVSNVAFEEDPTQPASRGLHFAPTVGTFGNGLIGQSNFTNVNVDNPALECLWLDGGGGPGYTGNLPNQYLIFQQFWCNGPNQSHPANLIKATGESLQIIFLNGQVNGQGWNNVSAPDYPNPLINITEKTTGQGDAPVDIKFIGYTCEVATQCLYAGNGSNSIHYDNSYIENVSSPFITVNSDADTFNGVHIANSGNITAAYQFSNSIGVSVRDNILYGGIAPSAALAVCSSASQADFQNNNIGSGSGSTTSCATVTGASAGGVIVLSPIASTASITEPDSDAITTLTAVGIAPGKTLTLYGPSGFQLATGGNIALGGYTSPVNIPSGGSATLTLMDSGVTWLLTAAPPQTVSAPNWSTIIHGANTDTNAFITSGQWTFNNNVYFDSSSGGVTAQFGPASTPGTSYTNVYDDGNFHIDGTASGTNRGLFFKGQSGSTIAFFQPSGGANEAEIGTDGSYLVQSTTGKLQLGSGRKGTFTCTAGGTITIANANEQATSDVVISLNAQAGTISTPPAMKTVTAGTGFTVLCGAADTSLYNYDILD